MKHERIKQLLKDDFTKLQNARVLLLGVGGVGGHCLDCLIRSGVRDITIVDYDIYDESNQNRQLWSELHVGELKTEALQKHYPDIKIINVHVEEQWVRDFDFSQYDVVLDAIDNTRAKLALAQACYRKLISSFGSAKRLDPTKVQVADIWKSAGDPLGKKIRRELTRRKFKSKYKVIFSSEEAVVTENKGSFVGVTATFGLTMCAEAIKKIRGL
ncbi:tRNA threonylcarbamoyladenosine dehydratase [Candidatus Sulfurimonas baltica]|uniref:ThiF family adenylyltransferase n=1 Tax=Candidatus Sulfurimonas baltica TaxID=2740404 RepID=A0A7S7RNI2_9BACT|nr:ThiF family adenylyltransferase [Candidatus Sulfurimonas baltica]QOY52574.1 ThiF family adenylyltransferase [Candidatus Sulfurimonas baltica]